MVIVSFASVSIVTDRIVLFKMFFRRIVFVLSELRVVWPHLVFLLLVAPPPVVFFVVVIFHDFLDQFFIFFGYLELVLLSHLVVILIVWLFKIINKSLFLIRWVEGAIRMYFSTVDSSISGGSKLEFSCLLADIVVFFHIFFLVSQLEIIPLEIDIEGSIDFIFVEKGLWGLLIGVHYVFVYSLGHGYHFTCLVCLHIRINPVVIELQCLIKNIVSQKIMPYHL